MERDPISVPFQSGTSSASDTTAFHDPWLTIADQDLQATSEAIFQTIEYNCPQPGRQRQDARQRRKAIAENILANLVSIIRHRPEGTRLAISTKNDAGTRYDRPGFSPRLIGAILNAMETTGLITRHVGFHGGPRTTIEPTPKLRAMLETPADMAPIGRAEGAETIILRAHAGRNRPKVLINYQDTEETQALRQEMHEVNEALGAADIRLVGKPVPEPTFLTRRFQIDSPEAPHTFNRHGRLYGGVWMNLPKAERHRLRVNGEPIVDLDFTACFPNLAYLEAGAALPNSDPYGGVEGLRRVGAKKALVALLCRSGAMRKLPKGLREIVGKGWTAESLVAAMKERHPAIAGLFGTGIGLKLMFTESRILLATVRRLFEQGIPAMPFHDGLHVPASKEREARLAMAQGSMEVLGLALPVAVKTITAPLWTTSSWSSPLGD